MKKEGLARHILFPLLAAHVFFPLLWLAVVAQEGPRLNDWRQFQVAAEQFVSGRWNDLYSGRLDSVHPGYLWLYPPFALYFVAPLAWLPPAWAYGLIACITIASLVGSMLLLARQTSIREKPAWVLAIALSAPALTTIIVGQISALILLTVAAAGLLWTRGRVVAACALMGLLAIKPNIGIFFGLYLIVRREWRGAAAMTAVIFVLCASTWPLGMKLWADFMRISMTRVDLLSQHEPYKLITSKAFLEIVLGPGKIAVVGWVTSALCLTAVAAAAWGRPGPPLRHLGLVALLTIVANPYGFFYDALLLVVPATAWWSERDSWRPDRWKFVGALIAVAWCWEQYSHPWREVLKFVGVTRDPPFSVVGPVAAVWLLVASLEAIAASKGGPGRPALRQSRSSATALGNTH